MMRRFILHAGFLALTIGAFHATDTAAQIVVVPGQGQGQAVPGNAGGGFGGLMGVPDVTQSPCQLVLNSDVIIIGKVTSIEAKSVEVAQDPNVPDKVSYKIAVVKISETIHGAKGLTHIKIGFLEGQQGEQIDAEDAPNNADPAKPKAPPANEGNEFGFLQVQAPQIPLPAAPAPPVQVCPVQLEPAEMPLKEGEEGCFILVKHHSGEFYTLLAPMIPSDDKGLKEQVASFKKIVRIIDEPVKALKAEKAVDRFRAALILISKYRTPRNNDGKEMKEVEISKNESKRILDALLEGNWTEEDEFTGISVAEVIELLGLEQEGFVNPNGAEEENVIPPGAQDGVVEADEVDMSKVKTAFEEWLKGKGSKYVIKKYVVEEAKPVEKGK